MREKNPHSHVHFALINIVSIDLGTSHAACFLLRAAKLSWDMDTLASTALLRRFNVAEFVHV